MNREETVKYIKEVADRISNKYGFCLVSMGEDRQKGIWGEKMTQFLEGKYGDCSTKIIWYKDDDTRCNHHLEFRYRFSNPVLTLYNYNGNKEVMGNIEFSSYDCETKQHTDNYYLSQCLSFGGKEGLALVNELITEFEAVSKNIL